MQQWAESKHAISGIGCYECHQAGKDRPDSFEHFSYRISVLVTPKVCGTCHAQQTEEFEASHHAMAGEILGSLDNVLGDIVEGPQAAINGCAKCHGSVVKVLGRRETRFHDLAQRRHWPHQSRRQQGIVLGVP